MSVTDPVPIENGCTSFQPTLLQRIGRRLFPAKHLDTPEIIMGGVNIAHDAIHTTVRIRVSWLDLLRLICSRRAKLTVKIATAHQIGMTKTAVLFGVEPPAPLALETPIEKQKPL